VFLKQFFIVFYFFVRDYDVTTNYNNVLDRVLQHRDSIISHLNWVCIFLGLHSFGIYIHNDTMSALGRQQDMFADSAIQLQPVFSTIFTKGSFFVFLVLLHRILH